MHNFFKDFISLFMRDRERERERQRHRQRENQAPCRKPDMGLDAGTLGIMPWAKGRCMLNCWATQASLQCKILNDLNPNVQKVWLDSVLCVCVCVLQVFKQIILIFFFSFSLQDISGTMKDLRFCPICKLASFNDAAGSMDIENWHKIPGSGKKKNPW